VCALNESGRVSYSGPDLMTLPALSFSDLMRTVASKSSPSLRVLMCVSSTVTLHIPDGFFGPGMAVTESMGRRGRSDVKNLMVIRW